MDATMDLNITPATHEDLPALVELVTDTFVHDGVSEYGGTMYPDWQLETGRRRTLLSLQSAREKAIDFRQVMKATLGHEEELVGCCVSLFHGSPPTSQPPFAVPVPHETQDDLEYAAHLKTERDTIMLKAFAQLQGPVLQPTHVAVKPQYQGKGVGGELMKLIIEWANDASIPIALIARPPAIPFYLKLGFEIVEDGEIPLPDKWKHKPRVRLTSMILRP